MNKNEKEIARGVYTGTLTTLMFYFLSTSESELSRFVYAFCWLAMWFMIHSNNFFTRK